MAEHTRLLVVDDEEGIRRAVNRALAKDGYEILLAEDGRKAIEMVSSMKAEVGVVISDFKMPGMDGLETLVAIGRLNPEITRILLTGYATLESAIQATNEGIDGFLTKPFDNEDLRARVREYFLRRRLKEFVSSTVLDELQKNPRSIEPRKVRASVLFADIRGFTALSERVEPVALSRFLSTRYFSPLGEVVFQNGGTLDKHIGDAVMAIFGAPLTHEDHAYMAVQCAVQMRDRLRDINDELRQLPEAGIQELAVGIGVATGEVVAGVFGSRRKKEYTVFGRSVNMAARLVALAKAGQILVCDTTFAALSGRAHGEALGPVAVKGIDAPLDVFNIMGLRGPELPA